jgi:plasmid stability protein
MATLTINSLDDGVYERLKSRARENNRSVEAEVRDLLEAQVLDEDPIESEKKMRAVIADIAAFQDGMRAKYGVQSDSVSAIRAIRDEE